MATASNQVVVGNADQTMSNDEKSKGMSDEHRLPIIDEGKGDSAENVPLLESENEKAKKAVTKRDMETGFNSVGSHKCNRWRLRLCKQNAPVTLAFNVIYY